MEYQWRVMIKRLKCDLGDDRLTKRGNASFQAYLDKTMICFLVYAEALWCPLNSCPLNSTFFNILDIRLISY